MRSYPLSFRLRRRLADTVTPVSLYLRLRDHFANPILLESSDYHGSENPYSFLCFDPIAGFEVQEGRAELFFPDGSRETRDLRSEHSLTDLLSAFLGSFLPESGAPLGQLPGFFGFQAYDAVRHYERVEIKTFESEARRIPDLCYRLYRYTLIINHFNNEMTLVESSLPGEAQGLERIEALIGQQSLPAYDFACAGEESSPYSDEQFLGMIRSGIAHCQRGDVFQIVLSRPFCQPFQGDEFQVYRQLRAVNPSPYLFFCDYGSFKLMGSSPEAQLVIRQGRAYIHPIAGTFRRSGQDEEDLALARKLSDDPKENSEHVMLVDLARNDLSRHGSDVKVETFKEIQYYSHVIHLVSKVSAAIGASVSPLQLAADTFPAGTLSGAPKHSAMTLIERYEAFNRGFYGGAIGMIGFDGSFNHAIMIRSLLSKQNVLHYQAGAGVVARSLPESELQEVHHKLMALRRAIALAAQSF
jgi:anthranilate synthase component 1